MYDMPLSEEEVSYVSQLVSVFIAGTAGGLIVRALTVLGGR